MPPRPSRNNARMGVDLGAEAVPAPHQVALSAEKVWGLMSSEVIFSACRCPIGDAAHVRDCQPMPPPPSMPKAHDRRRGDGAGARRLVTVRGAVPSWGRSNRLDRANGADLRNLPFLDRKAARRGCWRNTKACAVLSDIKDGLTMFAHACQLGSRSSPLSESLAAWLRIGRQPTGFLAYTQSSISASAITLPAACGESRRTLNFFLILAGRSRVQSILLA
jgi:hypothetical protein